MASCMNNPSAILLGIFVATAAYGSDDTCAAQECAALSLDSERLACYDRTFGVPMAAGGAINASGVRAAEARRDFGLSEADKRARDPAAAKASLPESLEASVVAVMRHARGELVVTLDNDQVWMQSEAVTQARLSAGDVVTIRKAALGSYQLVTPSGIAMRVRRVR